MKQRIYDRVTLFFIVVLVCFTGSIQGTRPAEAQEVLRGLDLSMVSLDLRVPGEFRKALEERAKKQFHDAGLKLGENNFPRSLSDISPGTLVWGLRLL